MKGITPVIAVILLLLMTVSLAGFAFVFLQRSTESITQAGGDQLGQQLIQGNERFSIVTADKNRVTLRNIGTSPIQGSSLAFIVGGRLINHSGPVSLAPGSMGTYIMNSTSASFDGYDLKVSGRGFSDTSSLEFRNELLRNPGFEEGSAGWSVSSYSNIDNATVHGGSKAGHIFNSSSYCNDYYYQDINLTQNTTYVFSGWLKKTATTTGVNGSNYPGIYIASTSWGAPSYVASSVPGQLNWTEYRIVFNSSSSNVLRFSFFMWWCAPGNTGDIWYDDAKLYALY